MLAEPEHQDAECGGDGPGRRGAPGHHLQGAILSIPILQQMMGWKLLSQNICCQVWPYEGKDKVDLLVPPQEGEMGRQTPHY